jgi:hypothetical protein
MVPESIRRQGKTGASLLPSTADRGDLNTIQIMNFPDSVSQRIAVYLFVLFFVPRVRPRIKRGAAISYLFGVTVADDAFRRLPLRLRRKIDTGNDIAGASLRPEHPRGIRQLLGSPFLATRRVPSRKMRAINR